MSETQTKPASNARFGKFIGPVAGVGALLFLMLFQGGFFATGQILPGINLEKPQNIGETLNIAETSRPDYYRAIGTVRSRNEIDIMPRIVARITEIKVRSGDRVKAGDVLAVLDAQDLTAGVAASQDQLRAANAAVAAADEQVKAARAVLDLAAKDLERNKSLFEKNAISRRDYDQAITAHKQAEAGLQQANQQRSGAAANAAAAAPTDGAAMRALAGAEGALRGVLGRLMVVVEQYPDLKANQNMMQLQEEIASTENRIAFARQAYNDEVMAYNTRREVFPSSLIASMFNFAAAQSLELESDAERQAPQVRF